MSHFKSLGLPCKMIAIGAAAAAVLVACSSDKSLTDYRNQTAQQNLATYSAVAKDYSGVAHDFAGKSLGSVTLSLKALMSAQSSSDNLGQESHAQMTATLKFDALVNTQVSFATVNYDQGSNSISASTTILNYADGGKTTKTLLLQGTVDGSNFSGLLKFSDDDSTAIVLNGTVAGITTAAIAEDSVRIRQLATMNSSYSGELPQNSSTGPRAIELVLSASATETAENVFNLMSIERPLSAVVRVTALGQSGPVTLTMTHTFDNSSGRCLITDLASGGNKYLQHLHASATSNGIAVVLDCDNKQFSTGMGFTCTLSPGVQGRFDLQPEAPSVK